MQSLKKTLYQQGRQKIEEHIIHKLYAKKGGINGSFYRRVPEDPRPGAFKPTPLMNYVTEKAKKVEQLIGRVQGGSVFGGWIKNSDTFEYTYVLDPRIDMAIDNLVAANWDVEKAKVTSNGVSKVANSEPPFVTYR